MSRRSKGRQKLEMVKIPNESNLMVTFSKRRSGLFKKASELATLCGAEVVIIVFSPGKKVFSFGHPSVDEVLDRFITGNVPRTSGAMQLIEAHRSVMVRELNMQLTQLLNQLELEKRRGEELDQMRRAGQSQRWWEAPIDDLDPQQLEQLKVVLQQLREQVAKQAEEILIQSANPPPPSFAPSSAAPILAYNPNDIGYNTGMDPGAGSAMVPYNPGNIGFDTNMGPYGYNPGGFRNGFY